MERSFDLERSWGPDKGASQALNQIAATCEAELHLSIRRTEQTFDTDLGKTSPAGILRVKGQLLEGVLVVSLEVLRAPAAVRLPIQALADRFLALGVNTRLVWSKGAATDAETRSLLIEYRLPAAPLAKAPLSEFALQLRHLDSEARALQAELLLPQPKSIDRAKLYTPVSEHLEPILPWSPLDPAWVPRELMAWVEETAEFLDGSLSVALVTTDSASEGLALAVLAEELERKGGSLGRVLSAALNGRAIVELARKAPGLLVISTNRLVLGINPYDMASEQRTLLSHLNSSGTPVLFTGSREDHCSVFHGGQAARLDPLAPVLLPVPAVDLKTVARFTVQTIGEQRGGISAKDTLALVDQVVTAVADLEPADQARLLTTTLTHAVTRHLAGTLSATSESTYVAKCKTHKESVSGLGRGSQSGRRRAMTTHLVERLTDPGLLDLLRTRLRGQDDPLAELVERLATQALTRPDYQPIRCLIQGPPGVGKSAVSHLLADRLDLPLWYIDGASLSDPYTATAKALGAGRGLVGSNEPGILAQAAASPHGALLEVADLDHA